MSTTKRQITIYEKKKILDAVIGGERQSSVCKRLNLSKSTVNTIVKRKAEILEVFENDEPLRERKRIRKAAYPQLETCLEKWLQLARSKNLPVSGPLLKAKASFFAMLLGINAFNGSDGWLSGFKKRKGIVLKIVCGESLGVADEVIGDWMKNLPNMIKDYAPEDIFSLDESGLFYRMRPNQTLSFKENPCRGSKFDKDRITIVTGCNMSGTEKLKLVVVGRFKNPPCFKNAKSLPVIYKHSKNALMTGDMFEEYVRSLDDTFFKQNRKTLLFVNNCAAHRILNGLKSIKLIFFPADATSVLQPCDQGIVRSVKAHYRECMMQELLNQMETPESVTKLPTLYDAIMWLSFAWHIVRKSTIKRCFKKCGFSAKEQQPDLNSEDYCSKETENLQKLVSELKKKGMSDLDEVNAEDILSVDNLAVVSESSDDLITSVVDSESTSNVEDVTENVNKTTLTKQQALNLIPDLKAYLSSCADVPDEVFNSLLNVETAIRKTRSSPSKTSDFIRKN